MTMTPEKLARLDALLDKQEIHERLTAFSRGMDRFDHASFSDAFWPDATIAAGPFVGTPQECWDWSIPMHEAGQVLTHHALLNCTIDIAGDTAHTETYYMFVARNRDESIWQAGGRYVDRFERRAKGSGQNEWRIAMRHNAIEWSCIPPAMPIPFGDVPDIAVNGISARSPGDVSYIRPLANQRERQVPG
jgi:SnoaL-like domain